MTGMTVYLRRMTNGRLMQCKDIPDAVFLTAVEETPPNGATWRLREDVRETLEAAVGPVPPKLLLAKARRLIDRKLLWGCACGCRGDWEMPEGG